MAGIDGGTLSFTSMMDNGQLDAAINETLRRVQGFSDAVVGSGAVMDKTTQEIVECIEIQRKVVQDLENTYSDLNAKINEIEPGEAQNVLIEEAQAVKKELDGERQGLVALMSELNSLQTTNNEVSGSMEQIRAGLGQIGAACEEHETELARLEDEYKRLAAEMNNAFMSGHDDEYRALQNKVNSIKGEITVRKQVLRELREQSNALEDEAAKLENAAKEAEKAAQSHVSFRTRLREVREELAAMELAGDTGSDQYKALQGELGALSEAMDAVTAQSATLKKGERMWDGLLSGLSGVSGAFSAAQGAVALFSGENENLQKIMLKVQSLMAITIGLKEVQLALDKDEAFRLVTINGLKEWWNKLLAIGRGEQVAATTVTAADTAATTVNAAAQTARTAATQASTAAQGANTVATNTQTAAAKAGTTANIGLAGAFRMVGAAIKSFPVFGWIIVGIYALISLVSHFVSKANEAKKAQEEWYKSVAENAYKPIAAIEDLATRWNALGDDLEAKKKFIDSNKKAFDELGVSVNDVADAENLLVANKDAFIEAQIAKAKAMILVQQAQEEVKALAEEQMKLDAMPKTKSVWIQTSSFGTGYYAKGENTDIKEKEKEIEDRKKALGQKLTDAANYEKEGWGKLKKAGIDAVNTYKAGTIGAIEQAIQEKQAALKNLQIGSAEFTATQKAIAGLKAKLDAAQGTNKGGGGGSGNTKDPFLDKLAKYKSEYTRFMKWINSGDDVLMKAANKEFSGLLKEGATYIDWLKKQRDTILEVDEANRTATQNKRFRQLNDAIAEETKKTVLESFNQELSEQLTNAKTVMEMLNLIEKKRKELSNDGTELDNGKKEALDEAEKNAKEQLKQETEALLEEYSSYVEKKRRLEEDFNNDMILLAKARAEAKTDEERANKDAAMQNRKARFDKDNQSSGDSDYDELKKQYKTYQSEITAIQNEYAEKRRVATLHNDQLLLAQLAQEEADKISEVQKNMLTSSVDWQQLFGNLDGLSTDTIKKLISSIEAQKINLSAQFNPQDLQAINEQLEKARDEIESRNPFKALGNAYEALRQSIKENKLLDSNNSFVQELNGIEEQYNQYKKWITSGNEALVKGANQNFAELLKNGGTYLDYLKNKKNELQGKIDMGIDVGDSMEVLDAMIHKVESGKSSSDLLRDALKDTFSGVSSSLEFVKGAFDSVTSGMEKMGIKMDDETQAVMTDIGGILEGSMQLSEGIASGNPLSIVQGSISLLSNTFDLFNSRDRKAEKSIKKHKEQIEKLQNAYKQLEWQIDKALGSEVYANQKAAIENMQAQQEHLRGMISDERSKKKTDKSKIQEYQEQIEEFDRQIEDMYDAIAKDILQTDAKDFAGTLGDSLVEAFKKGEDASKAFEATVNEVLQNAIVNQLKKKFLEQQLQGALDQLETSMGWNGDTFVFDGLTDAEIEAFKQKVQSAAGNFSQALEIYKDIFKDLGIEETDESLTGAVKGVTEETASIVAGQINAVRINQLEATTILRQSLQTLNMIAANTAFNRHLAKIDRIISLLEKNSSDSLRSQGLS